MMVVVLPCVAQEQQSSQATPDLSGTGNAGRIAVWKNSTTIGSSIISQSGENVGIGTTAPGSKLDVAGTINMSGGITYQGIPVMQIPGGLSNFNVGLGPFALGATTTGIGNTASGYAAMLYNTTGIGNSAYGNYALAYNTTGYSNTANGGSALEFNTTGYNNTAIGVNVLNSNITGIYNTASGSQAMYYNTTGASNTATGDNVLFYNTGGSNNTGSGEVHCSPTPLATLIPQAAKKPCS